MDVGADVISYKELIVFTAPDAMVAAQAAKAAGTDFPATWYKTYDAGEGTIWEYLGFRVLVSELYDAGAVSITGTFICDLATSAVVRVEAALVAVTAGVDVRDPDNLTFQGIDVTIAGPVYSPQYFTITPITSPETKLAKNKESYLVIRRRRGTAPDTAAGKAKFSALTIAIKRA